MAEHFRFFDSTTSDEREYTAAEFAEYFARFVPDNVCKGDDELGLKVEPGAGLKAKILPGYAFIRGYMYHNDAEMEKTLNSADSILERIDLVVLRLDQVAREMSIVVKTGNFSSTPQKPTLEETASVKELAIASVWIHANAQTISPGDITDEREDFSGVRTFVSASEPVAMRPGDLWFKVV